MSNLRVFSLLILLASFASTIKAEEDFDYSTKKSKNIEILMAGITQTNVYFMIMQTSTKQIYVYEFSRAQLEQNPERMPLVKKELLLNKWPSLWGNPSFYKWLYEDSRHVTYSFPIGKHTLFIFSLANSNDPKELGVYFIPETLEVGKSKFKDVRSGDGDYTNLSSDEPKTFYQFYKNTKSNLTIRYTYHYDGPEDIINGGLLDDFQSDRLLCKPSNDNSTKRIFFSKLDCEKFNGTPIRWPLLHGFVLKKRFYYFSEDQLYLFKKYDTDKESTPTEVKVIPITSWFQCKANIEEESWNTTWIIILIILLSMIINALACYYGFDYLDYSTIFIYQNNNENKQEDKNNATNAICKSHKCASSNNQKKTSSGKSNLSNASAMHCCGSSLPKTASKPGDHKNIIKSDT